MINLQLQYQKLEEQLEYIQTYIQSIELQKNMISEIENQITDQATLNSEYSCAMKSHFRKFGNQMSGSGNHLCNYASLLA